MKRILSALLFVLLAVAPAAAQYTLPGVYSPGVPGAGIDCDAGACLGRYVKFATVSGNDLTLTYQDANNAQQTLTFSGGLVTGGSLHTTTQELTLTLSGGTSVIIDLSGLTTAAEVSTAINLALSGYAQTADIEAFARVATTDTIPAARLASGGTSGQLLTRTSSGQSWTTFSRLRRQPDPGPCRRRHRHHLWRGQWRTARPSDRCQCPHLSGPVHWLRWAGVRGQ